MHTTVALGLAAGLVLTVAGVLFTPQLLRWMGTPEDVIGSSVAYFRVYFLGSSAVVLYNVGAGILQSVGDSPQPHGVPSGILGGECGAGSLFVAVLRRGVASAALATVISQALSAVLSFHKLAEPGTAYRVRWRRVRFDPGTLRQVLGLGLPSGGAELGDLAGKRDRAGQHQRLGSAAMAGCGAWQGGGLRLSAHYLRFPWPSPPL